jgi:hypothetical protein
MLATRKRSSIEPWMLTGADLRIVKLSRWLRPAKIRWIALDRGVADSPIASYSFLNGSEQWTDFSSFFKVSSKSF